MKLETLDGLKDAELQEIIARANEVLEERARRRKKEAIDQAQAVLAAAGLTVEDLRSSARKPAKGAPTYHIGMRYQHPDDASKTWAGKGKKPHWLRDLEKKGSKPVELK